MVGIGNNQVLSRWDAESTQSTHHHDNHSELSGVYRVFRKYKYTTNTNKVADIHTRYIYIAEGNIL